MDTVEFQTTRGATIGIWERLVPSVRDALEVLDNELTK